MSNQPRSVTHQGVNVTFKSTREIALEVAQRLPNLPLQTDKGVPAGTYAGLSYAQILVAEARLIESYLDESDPQTGGEAQAEPEPASKLPLEYLSEFQNSSEYQHNLNRPEVSAIDLYGIYNAWIVVKGAPGVTYSLFKKNLGL